MVIFPHVLPTTAPTFLPTASPSKSPTTAPSKLPTTTPSKLPTTTPSKSPTTTPSKSPSSPPTFLPTNNPTVRPSAPSVIPTLLPTRKPTVTPSSPTKTPSVKPTSSPTIRPSATPTVSPSKSPSTLPTLKPTVSPTTLRPTVQPTYLPTKSPTVIPSSPTRIPTMMPTNPTAKPTLLPTKKPSTRPSLTPTTPSGEPTGQPTGQPTLLHDIWEGGTNDVVKGVYHTFYNIPHTTTSTGAFLRVEVWPTDFNNADDTHEYVGSIQANGYEILPHKCSSQVDVGTAFYVCLYDVNISPFVNPAGDVTVRVTATKDVNSYPHNGYLLYVKMTLMSYYWMGGSGSWFTSHHWDKRTPPPQDSAAYITLSHNDTFTIQHNVTIHNLTITGEGIIALASKSIILKITGHFIFAGGYFIGPGTIICTGKSNLNGGRKFFKNIHLLNYGDMTWNNGDIIVNNSTIINNENGIINMNINSTATGKTSQLMRIKSDHSFYNFLEYSGKRLNTRINLQNTIPAEYAIYDLLIPNAVYITENTKSLEIWPLDVSQDSNAALYYSTEVNLQGYQYGLYNMSIFGVDTDQCADLCETYGSNNDNNNDNSNNNWCKSFDYILRFKHCLLSPFLMSDIGGLSDASSANVLAPTYASHYEYRNNENENNIRKSSISILRNYGVININSGNFSIEINIEQKNKGSFHMVDSDININNGMQLTDQSTLAICGGSLTIENQSLIMTTQAIITSGNSYCNNNINMNNNNIIGGLIFNNGVHTLSKNITNINMKIMNYADVTLVTHGQFHTVELQNTSTLKMIGNTSIVLDTLIMRSGSTFLVQNISMTARSIQMDTGASLTSHGMGMGSSSSSSSAVYGLGLGLGGGGGTSHALGGSGASHGGRGGSAAVDATGHTYGSVTHPMTYGSGGGSGRSGTGGGSGGGIISIHVNTLILNGTIDSDGGSGNSGVGGGGGGGSGGSVFLNVTSLFTGSGSGILSATGGDGGYAGGLVGGGGGSGGRIAVYCDNFAYMGGVRVFGGNRPVTYDNHAEEAGPGTAYLHIIVYESNAGSSGSGSASTKKSITAIFVSSQTVTHLVDNLYYKTSVNANELVAISPVTMRGAYILDNEIDNNDLFNSNEIDIHVIGNAPVYIASTNIHIGNIIGSGGAIVRIINNIHLYLHSSFILQYATLILDSAVLQKHSNITVQQGGILILYNTSHTSTSTTSGMFTLDTLHVRQGGIIWSQNRSVTLHTNRFLMDTQGSINIYNEMIISSTSTANFTNVNIYGTFPTSTSSSTSSQLVIPLSYQASFTGVNTLHNVSVVNYGTSTLLAGEMGFVDISYLKNYGLMKVLSHNTFMSSISIPTSTSTTTTTMNVITSVSSLIILESGSIFHIYPSCTLSMYVPLQSTGSLLIDSHSSVTIAGGGYCTPGTGSTTSTCNGTIEVGVGSTLRAAAVSSSPLAISNQPSFHISGGVILCNSSTYKHSLNKVNITAGILKIESKATVGSLSVHGGIVNVTGGVLDISKQMLFVDGLLAGEGHLNIDSTAIFTLSAIHNSNATILELNLTNNGTIITYNNNIIFARSVLIHNNGILQIKGHQKWLFGSIMYSFIQYKSTMLIDWPGVWNVDNITVDSCAERCNSESFTASREGAMQNIYNDKYACQSFLYNKKLKNCRFNIISPTNSQMMTSDSNRKEYSWDLYWKFPRWQTLPLLINSPSGVIEVQPSTSISIQIPCVNHGIITIHSNGNLEFTRGYNQSNIGAAIINGTISMINIGSHLNGQYLGTGVISMYHNGHILEKYLISPLLNMIIYGNLYCLQAMNKLILNSLTIITKDSSVTFNSTSTNIHIQSTLIIDNGLFQFNYPISLTINNILYIKNNGLLMSKMNILSNEFDTHDIILNANNITLSSGGTMDVSLMNAHVNTMHIMNTATVSCTGRGYSTYSITSERKYFTGHFGLSGSSGGTHGGVGGSGRAAKTTVSSGYGSIYYPRSWGTAGGGYMNGSLVYANNTVSNRIHTIYSTSAGGGCINITVMTSLVIDGMVECNGVSPQQSESGGGAGGSILLSAGTITGSGWIAAIGGRGSNETVAHSRIFGQGGGGGGGRIAIHVKSTATASFFTGVLSATGGYGYENGSAGTIFIDKGSTSGSSSGGISTSSRTIIVNNERIITSYMTLLDEACPLGPVDVIGNGGSHVVIAVTSTSPTSTTNKHFYLGNIGGDNTNAIIEVSNGTILEVNASTSSMSRSSIHVPSTTLYISGATLKLKDAILITYDIRIGPYGVLSLSELGSGISTSTLLTSTSTSIGIYRHNNVIINSNGQISFFYIDKPSTLSTTTSASSSNNLIRGKLLTSTMTIDAGGHVTADGLGFRGSWSLSDDTDNTISGRGYGGYGSLGGGGGSYGGEGGEGIEGIVRSPYGNSTYPHDLGSGGGGAFSPGGSGGGAIHIEAVHTMTVNGSITANGLSGGAAGTGGGSGGSIYIRAGSMTGHGIITATGGNGLYSSVAMGGGGSGGRIALHVNTGNSNGNNGNNNYTGVITAYGGLNIYTTELPNYELLTSSNGLNILTWLSEKSRKRAACGTIFISNTIHSNKLYNVVKIDNSGGASHQIIINYNSVINGIEQIISQSFTLADGFTSMTFDGYTINKLYLIGYSKLQWPHRTSLNLEDTINDATSTLYVAPQAILILSHVYIAMKELITIADGGIVYGGQDLSLQQSSILTIHPNGSWSHSLAVVPTTGLCNISSVNISGSSGVIFKDSTSYIDSSTEGYTGLDIMSSTSLFQQQQTSFHAVGNITTADGGWHAGLGGGGIMRTYTPYGNAYRPVTWGAAGGSTYTSRGGNGGGAIHVVVSKLLHVVGYISANGQDCVTDKGGGGAGGSVWLVVSSSGMFTGSGKITATGGDGCVAGGGAGAGGRIAVHATGNAFSGSFDVHSGWQTYITTLQNTSTTSTTTGGVYSLSDETAPAGGTIFISNSTGRGGVLTATNHGRRGSSIYIATTNDGSSVGGTGGNEYVDDIILCDSTMIIDSNWNLSTNSIRNLNENSQYLSNSKFYTGVKLIINDNNHITIRDKFTINGYEIQFNQAKLLLHGDISIGPNGTLAVSYTSTSTTNNTMNPPAYYVFTSLEIKNTGIFKVLSQQTFMDSSVVIYCKNLTVYSGGNISAHAVIDASKEWSSQGSTTSGSSTPTNTVYGVSSDGRKGGSGGSHAGSGTTGYNNINQLDGGTTSSAFRGSAMTPIGAGGPGGRGIRGSGGAGGGGLHMIVEDHFRLDGVIDVSGQTVGFETAAGGGAGGSLYIEIHGLFNGNGYITANGGNGGISILNTVQGGGGSGGRVSISACIDNFHGNITATGGLSLVPGNPPPRSRIFEHSYRLQSVQYSYLNIRPAAAGTVVRSLGGLNRGGRTGNNRKCSNDTVVNLLYVESWPLVSIYKYMIQHNLNQSIHNILSPPTTIFDFNSIISSRSTLQNISFQSIQIRYGGCTVRFQGSGIVHTKYIQGYENTSIEIADETTIAPSDPFIITNLTMTLSGSILGIVSCTLSSYAILEISPTANSRLLSKSYNTIVFKNLILQNSKIKGSIIYINSTSISLSHGSRITTDGMGYEGAGVGNSIGIGSGRGSNGVTGGSGGGYGGTGMSGVNGVYYEMKLDEILGTSLEAMQLNGVGSMLGGGRYGHAYYPSDAGSGGGSTGGPYGRGGNGGGIIRLIVSGDIYLDASSSVTADGESVYGGGGGGSGGSIFISADHIIGKGSIHANGGKTCTGGGDGTGDGVCTVDILLPGGGGGGGRVAIQAISYYYTGNISATVGTHARSLDGLIQSHMGSVYVDGPIENITLSLETTTRTAIDINLNMHGYNGNANGNNRPMWMMQRIITRASGHGSQNATEEYDAIVRGYWRLRYRSRVSEVISSQATPAEVHTALKSLHTGIGVIAVERVPSYPYDNIAP
eukprot:gene5233-10478_t